MTIVCTKCGNHHDFITGVPLPQGARCTFCGDLFKNQHLHVDMSQKGSMPVHTLAVSVGQVSIRQGNDAVDVIDENGRGRIRVSEPSGKANALLDDQALDSLADQCARLAETIRSRRGPPSQVMTFPRKKDVTQWRELAHYIVTFLRDRNGAELMDAFDGITVGSYNTLIAELAHILECGGPPPNWSKS